MKITHTSAPSGFPFFFLCSPRWLEQPVVSELLFSLSSRLTLISGSPGADVATWGTFLPKEVQPAALFSQINESLSYSFYYSLGAALST